MRLYVNGQLIAELNGWLINALANENARALDEVNELVVEYNAVLTGADIEEARRHTARWTEMGNSPGPVLRAGMAPPRPNQGPSVS